MSRKLYNYTQKQNLKTSFDITEITPIYWNKLEPGEKIENLTYKNLTRMITPILPTMDCPYIDLFAFAVPKRILIPYNQTINPEYKGYFSKYNKFFIDNFFKKVDWVDDKSALANYKQMTDDGGLKTLPVPLSASWKTSLLSKFGLNFDFNSQYQSDNLNFDLMNLFVYHKIYFDFFRQKQLEQIDYQVYIEQLINYFGKQTSGPFPTRVPSMPELELSKKSYIDAESEKDWKNGAEHGHTALNEHYNIYYFNKLHTCNVDNDFLNSLTFNSIDSKFMQNGLTINSWNEFKHSVFDEFIRNQKLSEHIDYGTQKDILLKVWNVDNGDKTSAKLIGYDRYTQGIRQIINQAKGSSSSQALGEVGGMSMTQNGGELIREYQATEETYIMVLAVPNYKMTINNLNISNEWVKPNDFKQFNPEADYIQDPFYNIDIFSDIPSTSTPTLLGYQTPFNTYRKKYDVVAGDILTNWKNWTYSIDLPTLSELNLNVMKAQKAPFKNTLISPEQDAFLTEWEFNADLKRVIKPTYMLVDDVVKGE